MADIQQWRRKIQPARVRNPLEPEDGGDQSGSAIPKHCIKKKVSSYFDFSHGLKPSNFVQDTSASQLPTWSTEQLFPDPTPEDEMDSVMCHLMSYPHEQLDLRFNNSLMRIFEGYLNLKDAKGELQRRLDEEVMRSQSITSKHNMAEKDWEDERQDYKDEVKRLEVILCKASKRGLAEVTLARQDSKLRARKDSNDHKETVFEFLEKSKRLDDSFYQVQRATMKPQSQSPSEKDRKASRQLAQKKSMSQIHADLPFGTPPNRDARFSLTNFSLLEQQDQQALEHTLGQKTSPKPRLSVSEDSFSAFSCVNDSLPEDNAIVQNTDEAADLSEIKHLAAALARRHNVDVAGIMPQLLNLFSLQQAPGSGRASSVPNGVIKEGRASAQLSASPRIVSDDLVAKRPTVLARASGFFQKLKPGLSIDSASVSLRTTRRFSFEPGDDAASQDVSLGQPVPSSSLRKSASLDVLRQPGLEGLCSARALSPVAASPTTSVAPTEGRPPSRIPTPVYSSSSLARPRQERENSASSLVTAMKQAEDLSKRSNSMSSSRYSPTAASAENLANAQQPIMSEYGPRSRPEQGTVNTPTLRSSAVTKPPSTTSNVKERRSPWKAAGPRGNQPDASPRESAASASRRENLRPMG